MIIAFYKPYGVISQFTAEVEGQRTLAEFNLPARVYPVGRLDLDSEGLLILSDEPWLNARLLRPERGHVKEYWVQVEGDPSDEALARLEAGVVIKGYHTLPCRVRRLDPPPVEPTGADSLRDDLVPPVVPVRIPPIRFRRNIPTRWLAIELTEGKNRQVRRMTAAVGYPTLRLIRVRIGQLRVTGLRVGEWRELKREEREMLLSPG